MSIVEKENVQAFEAFLSGWIDYTKDIKLSLIISEIDKSGSDLILMYGKNCSEEIMSQTLFIALKEKDCTNVVKCCIGYFGELGVKYLDLPDNEMIFLPPESVKHSLILSHAQSAKKKTYKEYTRLIMLQIDIDKQIEVCMKDLNYHPLIRELVDCKPEDCANITNFTFEAEYNVVDGSIEASFTFSYNYTCENGEIKDIRLTGERFFSEGYNECDDIIVYLYIDRKKINMYDLEEVEGCLLVEKLVEKYGENEDGEYGEGWEELMKK